MTDENFYTVKDPHNLIDIVNKTAFIAMPVNYFNSIADSIDQAKTDLTYLRLSLEKVELSKGTQELFEDVLGSLDTLLDMLRDK